MILRPLAFQILNYKSIRDSGICTLSGDGITVLAGQNEAGKTSILKALNDFNNDIGETAKTQDFVPDHAPESIPTVKILFKVDFQSINNLLKEANTPINPDVLARLSARGQLWITRTLLDGALRLEDEIVANWPEEIEGNPEENDKASEDIVISEESTELNDATLADFEEALYKSWPIFVYFDSFDDVLPREVAIDKTIKLSGGIQKEFPPVLPRSVKDFIKLANISLPKVRELADLPSEKQLRNYLNSKSAEVTGDFLDYWKQTIFGDQKIKLRAEHFRRATGLFLAFYADDGKTLQHPDQRSKGFSWFLSFYLRLAASVIEIQGRIEQIILVDEPGSFLHQKAQRDILDVLEKRIAKHDIVVYSSHSPYMMPPQKMHRVRIVAKDQTGSTFIADRITDERIQRDEKGDALSPIMAAIGLDIGMGSYVMHQENFVVEGITDYYYLHAWSMLLGKETVANRGIIAAKGTKNIPNLVSLCLAWSRTFAILVDRDNAGNQIANELQSAMNISKKIIVQPKDALIIEEIFSIQDFKLLLSHFEPKYKLDAGQSPSTAIKHQQIDKVLLARRFAEMVSDKSLTADMLTQKTKDSASLLLDNLEEALKHDAVFRIS